MNWHNADCVCAFAYESDEAFASFRAMSGGNLKDRFIYRGASPVDINRNRAAVADVLVRH